MVNFLPAVLVGGPPHAGKSVLFYHLSQALRSRHIAHYAMRACPDAEGDWFHEGNPAIVTPISQKSKLREWPSEFVQRVCHDLQHRCLPFLVDMGGKPTSEQECLLSLCTHAILLLRPDQPAMAQYWQNLTEEYNLFPLARFFSIREGDSAITSRSPFLEGTFAGLERHAQGVCNGPLFDALVEQVAALFSEYDLSTRKKELLEQAPTEIVLDLEDAIRSFTSSTRWEPAMLQPFLADLPSQVPLSIYGRAPSWLYAALACHTQHQPLYLFDPKFGWAQPVPVMLSAELSPEIQASTQVYEDMTVLNLSLLYERLEYFLPDPRAFPPVSTAKGLVISGRVPNWLLASLMRLYQANGVPWIAPFYPQINHAIVVYSCVSQYQPGGIVSIPAS